MSDIHILEGGNSYRCVMHFPVPNRTNYAGVNYRAAILGCNLGGKTVLQEGSGPGQISSAEKAQIETGEVVERVVSISHGCLVSAGADAAGAQRVLQQRYAQERAELTVIVFDGLQYWGMALSAG